MNNSDCKIQLLDLYFEKYDFNLNRSIENDKYSTAFEIKFSINKDDESKIKVTIDCTVKNEPESIVLNLVTIGIFEIDKESLDEDTYDELIRLNTVAIIFPYIRSQISLLTTQPFMKPIVMPPININSIMKQN